MLRTFIIGAGASVPYGLPTGVQLMQRAVNRVTELDHRNTELRSKSFGRDLRPDLISDGATHALIESYEQSGKTIAQVAETFRDNRVQSNLDDFVHDHPSFSQIAATLIVIELTAAMYQRAGAYWKLRPPFFITGSDYNSDWMRRFVGVLRPLTKSVSAKFAVVSFNYDGILERSIRMFWNRSERSYGSVDELFQFNYPHGRISKLPEAISDSNMKTVIADQARNIRIGANDDPDAITQARKLVRMTFRTYSLGFSFSPGNLELLDLSPRNDARSDERTQALLRMRVQNLNFADARLTRTLASLGVLHSEGGSLIDLTNNGFFE